MKNETQETVAAITLDQFKQVCDQVDTELGEAMSEVFAQKRIRLKAASYVETLCRDDVPVKTCWDMAEAAGLERPRPFQSLMSVNDWDSGDLWSVIARNASALLVCPDSDPLGPGIAVDETGQPKRGRHTAGVGVQYAGFAGKKVNCVTSVTLCLITPSASTWVGNELFLQEKEWFSGQDGKGTARRQSAGVRADLEFESKPEIARRKLAELRAAGVKFGWAAGDEVYGRSTKLRKDHEDNQGAYAYFVPRDFVVELPSGARARVDEALHLARGRSEVRACGDGLNGPRLYAWTMIATASPEHFLVIRQPMDDDEPDPEMRSGGGEQGTGNDAAVRNPRTEKLTPDWICLGVLASWVSRDVVDEAIETTGKTAKRSGGKLPPHVMIYFVMALSLYADDDYEEVIVKLIETLREWACWDDQWGSPTSSMVKTRFLD